MSTARGGAPLILRAHRLNPAAPDPRPASSRREWMDATRHRFAYRCLPLVVANSIGWDLVSALSFDAVWLGGDHEGQVQVRVLGNRDPVLERLAPEGHFGHGILTLQTGLLLTTPEPFGLFVGAPVNTPRDAVSQLSGFVETNWLPYPFTINWQFTRRGVPLRVHRGEPIATVWPMDPSEMESCVLEVGPIESDIALASRWEHWRDARDAHLLSSTKESTSDGDSGWQRDYVRGGDPRGARPAERTHRTRLRLSAVVDDRADAIRSVPVAAPAAGARRGWHWCGGVEVCGFEADGAVLVQAETAGDLVRLPRSLYEVLHACRDGSLTDLLQRKEAPEVRAVVERFVALRLIAYRD